MTNVLFKFSFVIIFYIHVLMDRTTQTTNFNTTVLNETGNLMREKERNVLFNDALNTFYLRLYGVRHMVKDHSDSEK